MIDSLVSCVAVGVLIGLLVVTDTTAFHRLDSSDYKRPKYVVIMSRYISRLWGQAHTDYLHHEEPIHLSTKTEDKVSLAEFTKAHIPSCRLNPLLFNGHLQTWWTALKETDIPIVYRRKVFESTYNVYPGTFAIDFVVRSMEGRKYDPSLPPRTHFMTDEEFEGIGSNDDKPMLILLHGLAGGSHEAYLRHVLKPLILDDSRWEACVVNARGCAMSKITTPILYNARATWDVRQTVAFIREKFPNRKLFGIGFSLGANIITNYIAEEGSDCLLDAAIVVSNPWNLEVSSIALKRTWLGLHVYMAAMGRSMFRLFEQHFELMSRVKGLDVEKVRKSKYLFEFDRHVQCPTWGWPTESAYYRDASSAESVLAVRIPFLAIHAEDDPIAVNEAVPRQEIEKNPYVVLCSTNLGGHLSWFEIGGNRWFAKAIGSWLNAMADKIDLKAVHQMPGFDRKREGALASADGKTPEYDPLRHKLHVPAKVPQ